MTAGEKSLKAAQDNHPYQVNEITHAWYDEAMHNIRICAENHEKIIGEDEYFVILLICSDPLLKNLRRNKFYADLFLPEPRPHQVVCMYNRHTQKLKRLWSLPSPKMMAAISEATVIAPQWRETRAWVDAFYAGNFWETIRKMHNIDHLSREEYKSVHRDKLIDAGMKIRSAGLSDPVDAAQVSIDKVYQTK